MAVAGVTDENHARQLAVAQRELLVHAKRGIFIPHRLDPAPVRPFAGREDVDPHDFELGGLHRPGISRSLVPGDGRRQHFALLEERRHEPVADPLCSVHSPTAKMSGLDVSIQSLTTMPRLTVRPAFRAQLDVWSNASRHDDEIGLERRSVRELDAGTVSPPSIALVLLPSSTFTPSPRSSTGGSHRRRDRAAVPSACPSGARR